MTTNFFSGKPQIYNLVRSPSAAMDRYFSVRKNQRNPQAKDSRPAQKVIMRQMDLRINHKLKLHDCSLEMHKTQWLSKLNKLYGHNSFKRSKIVIKDLDKISISSGDILAMSASDFSIKPKSTISKSQYLSATSKPTSSINTEIILPRRRNIILIHTKPIINKNRPT